MQVKLKPKEERIIRIHPSGLELATSQVEKTEALISKLEAKKMMAETDLKVVYGEKQID